MRNKTLIVTFTAPEHSGKTSIEAAFAKFCQQYGISVAMPPDPQRDEKMAQPIEELMAHFKEKGLPIMIMESNAVR